MPVTVLARILLGSLLTLTAGAAVPQEPGGWRPFRLGGHHRTVSTRVPAAQKAFDQGLIWAFAFNHDEAVRAFREAARQDPGLAMAWWGIALANGPHINNPSMDAEHAKAAWEALGEARRRLRGASKVERALIEALGARYAEAPPEDRGPLDEAYAKAMGEAARRFPQDADLAALHAEALMDLHPWDQWTREGEARPWTGATLAELRRALALEPRNPLALHLTIHALEASPHPERAKAAADLLGPLAPDASHLVHMPGHIYARIGDWQGAARANEAAIAADTAYKARTPEIGFYGMYMIHDDDFLAYTAFMEGREEAALAQSKVVVGAMPPAWVKAHAVFADAYQVRYWEALKRFGRWRDLLEEPLPDPDLPVSTAAWHALRGTALAALGQVDGAVAEQALFEASLAKVPAASRWGTNGALEVLKVDRAFLAGELAYRRGNLDQAVEQLRQAVRLEDDLQYDEPPAVMVPSRHALGAVLLAAARAPEAEAVYREDLRAYPANYWSLLGLKQALENQGKADPKLLAGLAKAQRRTRLEAKASCLCVN